MENEQIKSSCHCGALKLEINGEIPTQLTSCNCSICRRTGGLMAYYNPSQVKIIAAEDATHEYAWGDKSLAQVRCSNCGCLSHWRSLDPTHSERMGINARLFENVDISKIKNSKIDGADTWKFLD